MSHKNPAAYRPFATNKGVKTKKSTYTARFTRRFPKAKDLVGKGKGNRCSSFLYHPSL